MSIQITDAKLNYEKIKNKYYENCKNHLEQQKIVEKFMKKIQKNNSKSIFTELENSQDMLLKFKCQCDNYLLLYNYEITKINKIYEDNDILYSELYNKIRANEESRIFFTKCNLEKFSKLFEEFSLHSFDFLNVINF